jgi:transcriptional regulator with XRE-family HTH domain
MSDDYRLAKLIAMYRTRAGLSQGALARDSGVNASYVNRLERNPMGPNNHPSREFVLRMATALKVTDWERDKLLHTAGHATVINWMKVCLKLEKVYLKLKKEASSSQEAS